MHQKPRIKQVRTVCQSRLFTVEQLDLEFSNGQQAVFERIRANAGRAVMIVAVNDNNEVLLIQEYAAGTERYELQLPKGIIEADEDLLVAANRELAEETGYAARQLKTLRSFRVAPGYFLHETHLVMATGLYPHQLDSGDEPEPLQLVRHSLHDVDSLLQREDFTEARSLAAVLLVKRELGLP